MANIVRVSVADNLNMSSVRYLEITRQTYRFRRL